MKTNTNKKLGSSKKICLKCEKKCSDLDYKPIKKFVFESVDDDHKKYVVYCQTKEKIFGDVVSEQSYRICNLNFDELAGVLEEIAKRRCFDSEEELVSLNIAEINDKE